MAKMMNLKGASRRSLLQQAGAAAIGITFAGAAGCTKQGDGRVVHFYNWGHLSAKPRSRISKPRPACRCR